MSSTLIRRSLRYLEDAARAFERAPVEVAVAVFLAAALSYTIEASGDSFPVWVQLAVCGGLVITGAWTGTLLHAVGACSASRRWTYAFAGVLAAVLYVTFVPNLELEAHAWRTLLVTVMAVLWLIAMPALARNVATAVDRVRVINGRVLLRILGALLYTTALYAGLALALAAIDNLFELDLDEAIYAHVAGWLYVVLAPWIVIGGLSEYVRPIGASSALAGVVHRMSAFLVPPLLALYYVILYAYAIRIGVTGEIPKNLVSPMVLAAGVLGTVALYLFEPRPDAVATSRGLRFTPPLFVPLAALGIWAITLRVDQYGWTEFRLIRLFALIVLGTLAIGATIQLLRRQRFSLHVLPLVLAATLLLSTVGPWSVLSLARHSQQERLARALEAAGIAPDDTAEQIEPRTVSTEIFDPINSTARYLAQHFGPESLPPVLARLATDRAATFDLATRIGLSRAGSVAETDRSVNGELASGTGVDVDGMTVERLVVFTGRSAVPGGPNAVVDSMTLRIHRGLEMLEADLSDVVGALGTGPGRPSADLTGDAAQVPVVDTNGQRRGTLIVLSISGRVDNGMLILGRLDVLLMLGSTAR